MLDAGGLNLVQNSTFEGGLADWVLAPCVDVSRVDPKLRASFTPVLEKIFRAGEGGSIIGRMGLGKEFYESKRVDTLAGLGTIWVTKRDWPTDLGDFEMTWEYRWSMPGKKFADCPFMKMGFRLDKEGVGYGLALHGWTAPLVIERIEKGVNNSTGRGRYAKYQADAAWHKFRLRAAGPILKAKVWREKDPEPERWTTEAFDDWSGAPGDTFKKGGFAVGFSNVKVFDTADYEYRNIAIRPLSADAVKAEISFDARTEPDYPVDVGGTEDLVTKNREELLKNPPAIDAKAAEGYAKDKNLLIEAGPEGLVLKSTDGAPAFLWLPEARYPFLAVVQAKATAGSRPLLALRDAKAEPDAYAYLDPIWREGLAAMLHRNAKHTGDIVRSNFKPDTWYNLLTQRSHIQSWRVVEPGAEGKSIAAFRYSCGAEYGKMDAYGIGVAGKGTVTVKGFAIQGK